MIIVLTRAFFILLGILFGHQLSIYLYPSHLTNIVQFWIGFISLSLIFGITGLILGGYVGKYLKYLQGKVEDFIGRMPIPDLIFSIIGILLGIVIGAPAYLGLSKIQLPSIIGTTISMFVYLLIILFTTRIVYRSKDRILNLIRKKDKIYVEKGAISQEKYTAKAKILDTSSIIDGRIYHICSTGFIEGAIIIPNFVIEELQKLADSSEDLKRKRGRIGLDMLHKLREEKKVEVKIIDTDFPNLEGVDSKLVQLAKELKSAIITNDYNLNKVARLKRVEVLNVNELSNAVKQIILPGEKITVQVIKEGKEEDQGIAYLDDGTMIVVENGKKLVGETVNVEVKGFLQTPAGRMIFTKLLKENQKRFFNKR
ncbi:unnamed protein product [marine sediment metagenome]|uniref:TRAM domain-containing protein n=2 Tax=marine sediment metagenome TaxID=412755 RepID=X0ZWH2_9ZZZZ